MDSFVGLGSPIGGLVGITLLQSPETQDDEMKIKKKAASRFDVIEVPFFCILNPLNVSLFDDNMALSTLYPNPLWTAKRNSMLSFDGLCFLFF